MKLRKFKSNEHGAVVVLVALSLTALFGFTALAVDFGMMASNKQGMQNACDAAALAAATDIKDGKSDSVITSTGYTYSKVNGFDNNDDDTQVTVTRNGSQVTVTIQQEMQMGFSGVLTGERTRTVSATATAESTTAFGGYPYALFANSEIDFGSGNDHDITGNVHCNGKVSISGKIWGNSVITCPDKPTISESNYRDNSKWSGAEQFAVLSMPKIEAFEYAMNSSNLVTFDRSFTIKKNQYSFQDLIDDAIEACRDKEKMREEGLFIYVTGSITSNGKGSSTYKADFPITLIVEGDARLNGATLESDVDNPFYIMSKTGGVRVNGGGAGLAGIVYAPNGTIDFNGNTVNITGSLIANRIEKSGNEVNITYAENIDKFLPDGKVRLIR